MQQQYKDLQIVENMATHTLRNTYTYHVYASTFSLVSIQFLFSMQDHNHDVQMPKGSRSKYISDYVFFTWCTKTAVFLGSNTSPATQNEIYWWWRKKECFFFFFGSRHFSVAGFPFSISRKSYSSIFLAKSLLSDPRFQRKQRKTQHIIE